MCSTIFSKKGSSVYEYIYFFCFCINISALVMQICWSMIIFTNHIFVALGLHSELVKGVQAWDFLPCVFTSATQEPVCLNTGVWYSSFCMRMADAEHKLKVLYADGWFWAKAVSFVCVWRLLSINWKFCMRMADAEQKLKVLYAYGGYTEHKLKVLHADGGCWA